MIINSLDFLNGITYRLSRRLIGAIAPARALTWSRSLFSVEAWQPRCSIFMRPVKSQIYRKVTCYALVRPRDALLQQREDS